MDNDDKPFRIRILLWCSCIEDDVEFWADRARQQWVCENCGVTVPY